VFDTMRWSYNFVAVELNICNEPIKIHFTRKERTIDNNLFTNKRNIYIAVFVFEHASVDHDIVTRANNVPKNIANA